MLTESGFYPNTQLLAQPLSLAKQLPLIAQELSRVNNFYPRSAHDSAVLLFSIYDALPKFIQNERYFLPRLNGNDDTIFAALRIAVFDDIARASHESASYLHQFHASFSPSGHYPVVSKTKAFAGRSEIWSFSKGEDKLKLEGLFVTKKKPGQDETAATWHQRCNSFPEPEDLRTAMANVFNVMTYPKPDDKTRIYNMPTHRGRMIRAYEQLRQALQKDEQQLEQLPEVVRGYTCFLMGWLHEQRLIDQSSPAEAAVFYQRASARGQFLPLGLKAGDLYVEIGDYDQAHGCYELVRNYLQMTIDDIRARQNGGPMPEHNGYLCQSFLDYLRSKIEYLSIKAKDTVYLQNLTPEEIQQYINGVTSPTSLSPISNEVEPNGSGADAVLAEPDQQSCETQGAAVAKNKTRNRASLCKLVKNRLSSQWDPVVYRVLKRYFQRKKQAKFTPVEHIEWLNTVLKKLKKKRGVELLMENLAWEHIHTAEQARFDPHSTAAKMAREHLNIARDLLLENIIYKTGIRYNELPQPDHFEADVLAMVVVVTCDLSSVEITEWLFGIVCQARSLGHVFSTFKLLYPGSKTIDSLNKGWFSLKRLYGTS